MPETTLLMTPYEWFHLSAESRHNINLLWRALVGLHELVLETGRGIRPIDGCRSGERWVQDNEHILDDRRYDLATHVLGYGKEE